MKLFRTLLLLSIFYLLSACGTQNPAVVQQHKALKTNKVKKPLFISKYKDKPKDYKAIKVQKGDTLYDIAIRYDIPSKDIIEKNNLKPPYILKVGQVLRLAYPHFHTVVSGDTLSGISRKYNLNMKKLAYANGIKPPYNLKLGQKIRLPYTGGEKSISSAKSKSKSSSEYRDKKKGSSFFSNFFNKIKNSTNKLGSKKSRPRQKKKTVEAPAGSKWDGRFSWPLKGRVISKFGAKSGGLYNDGINIMAAMGSTIRAAADGTVIYLGNELKGYGNLMIIRHNNGWVTAYAHQEKFKVKKGGWVKKGQVIGSVGQSGNVSKPQLHFAIRKGRESYDPLQYLPR